MHLAFSACLCFLGLWKYLLHMPCVACICRLQLFGLKYRLDVDVCYQMVIVFKWLFELEWQWCLSTVTTVQDMEPLLSSQFFCKVFIYQKGIGGISAQQQLCNISQQKFTSFTIVCMTTLNHNESFLSSWSYYQAVPERCKSDPEVNVARPFIDNTKYCKIIGILIYCSGAAFLFF